MPAVMRRLMRHSSVATTMGNYVDLDSAEVADQLWASYGNDPAEGNISGNTHPERAKNTEGATAQVLAETPDSQDVRAIPSQWTG
jgi:hypothetical protein